MQTYYQQKGSEYFSNTRTDIIQLLPVKQPGLKVLEIGAGGCDTLVYLKEKMSAAEVWGVELMRLPGSNQDNPAIDRLLIGDVDEMLKEVPPDYFDVIICADVLEHLEDPWKTIRRLTGLLKKGGYLMASLPNFREIGNMATIFLKGNFRYESSGIRDKTHLRFFCKENIRELVESAGLTVQRLVSNMHIRQPLLYRRLADMVTFGIFRQFFSKQYIAIATR